MGGLGIHLTRPVKTLRVEVNDGRRRWQPRSPAMAAGLTDHIWTETTNKEREEKNGI